MVCGASRDNKAQALLYRSDDMIHWTFFNVLAESRGEWGYYSDDLSSRIYTIETLIEEIKENYIFQNDKEMKLLITKALMAILETSRAGNELFIDNDQLAIHRGFRYGENSELFFFAGVVFFYAFVNALYFYAGRNGYLKSYKQFLEKLEVHFRKEKYLNVLISECIFNFLKKYFAGLNEDRLDEQVTNKNFVLDKYWTSSQNNAIKHFVTKAMSLVQQWLLLEEGLT